MKNHNRMSMQSLSSVSYGKAGNRFNVGQMKSFINAKEYWVHPIYDLYGANKQGEVINIHIGIPRKGGYHPNGYLITGVIGSRHIKHKTVRVHRFIYECYNGLIPDDMVIDHINDIKDDNRLCNLQLMTQQQNCKKSAVNRDFSFLANRNGKRVKATNLKTNEVSYYKSQYAAAKYLDANNSSVMMCCKGAYGYKTCKSKKDGCKYAFEYV